MKLTHAIISLLLIISLIGCGGSSTSENNTSPIVPTSIIALDTDLQTNQAVELILYAPDENISDITWQQTSGESVNFLTPHSKVIAFTPTSAGNYSFSVSFNNNNGTQTLTKTINVNSNTSLLSARLGHAVLEGNKVSLRAWLDETLNTSSVTWQQTSGPTVSFTDYNNGDLAVFFNAPTVNKDEVLEFTVQASDGTTTYTDTIAILVENAASIPTDAYFTDRVARVYPYKVDSPYANSLVNCTYSNSLRSSCKLGDLPLIAQQSLTPTVNDIMSRVVVSHQWMGDRFKAFLENYDSNNDFKNLLRATTAIIISYDVRPSFYWRATGAIYLDANNFWITPDERDTINEAPDYRSAFGKDLQFVMPWRYVKDNNYVSRYIAPDQRITRQIEDGLYRLTSLLFHELAHANDFFPSNEWNIHSSNTRILDAASSTNFESDGLALQYPLLSTEMRSLAQVSFQGASATETQKNYSPSDVSAFFSADNATDYYNYSSLREDFAMLFDEVMMYTRYQIQRDVAVTNRPTGDNVTAVDYIVDWGQRNRVGETNIKPRAKYVLERVLPEIDATATINALPTPIAMIAGQNWRENLQLNSIPQPLNKIDLQYSQQKQTEAQTNDDNRPIIEWRYYHKALPTH